jgi:phosphate transport system substrate-binding protein
MKSLCTTPLRGFVLLLPWVVGAGIAWGQNNVRLVGIGGTFPQPIYSKWLQSYEEEHPRVHLDYLPQGSGQGIESITSGQSDYAGTDAPLTEKQLKQASVRVLHFPTVVSGVVPIYNVVGLDKSLKFTPAALAGIYLGHITQWNDPIIVRENPRVQLPASRITVIHTANGRGTTYIWSDYLSKVSAEWKMHVGKGTSVQWPVGSSAEGNGNMARMVAETPNAIGYVELPFALVNHLSYGSVRNASGNFVTADLTV